MAKKEPELESLTDIVLKEATPAVEKELALEDAGWLNLSQQSTQLFTENQRIEHIKLSRLYSTKDPLGKQSIRLWTDYTFGSGMTWSISDDAPATKAILEAFWNNPKNKPVLSGRGQRKSSDKLLIDGDLFFAIFLGPKGDSKIRRIDPLEMTEILCNPEDSEEIRYYRRYWSDPTGKVHDDYYRDWTNEKGEPGLGINGQVDKHTQDALIYHVAYNTITQRGNPLLLPALDWMKQYRRFLASRVAIMLALARFAWKTKVMGGQARTDAIKAKTEGKEINAGSQLIENQGSETTPVKQESGARNAYEDGRQLKLMVSAAVGIPEQYFGDISSGNLATAKTVELPMMKMFQSYQATWRDIYKDINAIVLSNSGIPEDKWYVDMDFPPIAPEDVVQMAQSMKEITTIFPEFTESTDVKQQALMVLGINDPQKVLEELDKLAEEEEKTEDEEPPAEVPPVEEPAPGEEIPPEEEATIENSNSGVELLRTLRQFKKENFKEEQHGQDKGE